MSSINSIHPNGYDETDTRYELKWNSEGQIYLNAYSHQLLPMTKRRMTIDVNGDFSVFEIKKIKSLTKPKKQK